MYSLLVPVVILLLTFLMSGLCVGVILLAYSSGELQMSWYDVPLAKFSPSPLAAGMMGVAGFMWVWLTILLFSSGQYAVAHMVADWYY